MQPPSDSSSSSDSSQPPMSSSPQNEPTESLASPLDAANESPSEIEQSIAQLEASLQQLKQRYADVISAQAQRSELRAQYNRTQHQLRQHRTAQLKDELKTLQQQIDEVEVTLESQLFSWSSLREPFWMAVRFGGLGVILGWILQTLASG